MSISINASKDYLIHPDNSISVYGSRDHIVHPEKPDLTVTGAKAEYAIVGDAFFVTQSASVPPWLADFIDDITSASLSGAMVDVGVIKNSLLDAYDSIQIAHNSYAEAINVIESVDSVVASKVAQLNATYNDNLVNITDAQTAFVSEALALGSRIDGIVARLDDGADGLEARVTNLQYAITSLNGLHTELEDLLLNASDGLKAAVAGELINVKAQVKDDIVAETDAMFLSYADEVQAASRASLNASARAGGFTAGAQSAVEAVADIYGNTMSKYSVKVDSARGMVEGFELSSSNGGRWTSNNPRGKVVGNSPLLIDSIPAEHTLSLSFPTIGRVGYTGLVPPEELPPGTDEVATLTASAYGTASWFSNHYGTFTTEITRTINGAFASTLFAPGSAPLPDNFQVKFEIKDKNGTLVDTIIYTWTILGTGSIDAIFRVDKFAVMSPDGNKTEVFEIDTDTSQVMIKNAVIGKVSTDKIVDSNDDTVFENDGTATYLKANYFKVHHEEGGNEVTIDKNGITVKSMHDGRLVTRVRLGVW